MTKISLFTCLLSALTLVEMEAVNKSGRVGTDLSFTCSDWNIWTSIKDNVKYFCRSPCSENKHVIVKAVYKKTKRTDRIEITNSENGLYVTFFNLHKSDAGKYYCGVERNFKDAFLEVNVQVTDAKPSSPKTTPKTVHAAVTTGPPTSSNGSTVYTEASSTSESFNTSTTQALQSQDRGSVLYLIISLMVITLTMVVLIIVWKKTKKQAKAVSRAHRPQEDEQEDIQYDEIRYENQHPENTTLEHSADPDSVYANTSVLRTELSAQGENNYYSNDASPNPALCSGVCSRGASSQSRDTDLQSDLVYSLAELPNQKTNPAGQSELNQLESAKNEIIYSLLQQTETA